jgi:hypothetical protein
MYNPWPRFHDISFVLIGADSLAFVMEKVASLGSSVLPKTISKERITKLASILKRVPALSHKIPRTPTLPIKTLDSLSGFPLESLLSSLTALGIILKPIEFQMLVLSRDGQKELGTLLFKKKIGFSPCAHMSKGVSLDLRMANYPVISRALRPHMSSRSMLGHMILNRPRTRSFSDDIVRHVTMEKIAGQYNSYRVEALKNLDRCVSFAEADRNLFSDVREVPLEEAFLFHMEKKAKLSTVSSSVSPLTLASFYDTYENRGAGKEGNNGPTSGAFQQEMALALLKQGRHQFEEGTLSPSTLAHSELVVSNY